MNIELQRAILHTLRQKAGNWIDSEELRKSLAVVPPAGEFAETVIATQQIKLSRRSTGTFLRVSS